MKFIHLTDTHLVPPGEQIYGLDPYQRLEACVENINAHHGDADCCIVTGDLADRGEAAAYQGLRTVLERLAMPWHLLLGNHDNRMVFREHFPEAPVDADGFVQRVLSKPRGRFIFLDTLDEGSHAGAFCAARGAWLRAQLDAAGDHPVYLFMHHPPFEIGIPSLDRISLLDPAHFIAAIQECQTIRHLFFGHVHRPVSGSWRGIPFSTLRATAHQVAFDFETVEPVPKSHEPPAYGVVFLHDDRVIVHSHDYLDRTVLVQRGDGWEYAD